jgi:hypothetical protein
MGIPRPTLTTFQLLVLFHVVKKRPKVEISSRWCHLAETVSKFDRPTQGDSFRSLCSFYLPYLSRTFEDFVISTGSGFHHHGSDRSEVTSLFSFSTPLLHKWPLEFMVRLLQFKNYSTFLFDFKLPFGLKFGICGILGHLMSQCISETPKRYIIASNRVVQVIVRVCATLVREKLFEKCQKKKVTKSSFFHVCVTAPLCNRLQ